MIPYRQTTSRRFVGIIGEGPLITCSHALCQANICIDLDSALAVRPRTWLTYYIARVEVLKGVDISSGFLKDTLSDLLMPLFITYTHQSLPRDCPVTLESGNSCGLPSNASGNSGVIPSPGSSRSVSSGNSYLGGTALALAPAPSPGSSGLLKGHPSALALRSTCCARARALLRLLHR